jgi:hypothetical protein
MSERTASSQGDVVEQSLLMEGSVCLLGSGCFAAGVGAFQGPNLNLIWKFLAFHSPGLWIRLQKK